jgi:lysophospholipase L1-like esterase
VLLHNRNAATELQPCIEALLQQITPSKKVIIMTYPPVTNPIIFGQADFGTPWGMASQNNVRLLQVNQAIRQAVVNHNAKPMASQVLLADTSTAWADWESLSFIQGDGIHPNVAGARRLATTWFHQVCGRGFIACVN